MKFELKLLAQRLVEVGYVLPANFIFAGPVRPPLCCMFAHSKASVYDFLIIHYLNRKKVNIPMNIIIYLCHLWFDLPNNNNYPGWHTGSITLGLCSQKLALQQGLL